MFREVCRDILEKDRDGTQQAEVATYCKEEGRERERRWAPVPLNLGRHCQGVVVVKDSCPDSRQSGKSGMRVEKLTERR